MKKDRMNIEYTLKGINSAKRFPKSAFFLFILLYIIANFFIAKFARTPGSIMLFNNDIPFSVFTGVFSSFSNICVILLVVFYRKIGYISALAFQLYQIPTLCVNFFGFHNSTAVSGIFSNLFILFASTVIFLFNIRTAKYEEQMRKQALIDLLTGLPNRFACGELIKKLIKRGVKFSIVSIDLNNFKNINDTMGHSVGNHVLVEIASRWKEIADSWKSGTVDFVGRLGGDEFIIIIREYENEEQVKQTIDCYKKELEKVIVVNDCEYYLTACFGYAEFPTDADNDAKLVSCADAAMHEVKKNRNDLSVRRFTEDLFKAEHTLEIERIIRTAMESDGLYYNLQPQYDMNHKLRGFEVLARMKDKDNNFISPAEFIPVAENTGIIDKLDLKVFQKSAAFFGELLKKTDENITLSINISVKHLMKNNFIDEIKQVLEENEIPASNLEVEITESIIIESPEKALAKIKALKEMGIKIAIDDFGTGYSSLSYLNTLPFDLLKVDKAFIDELNADKSSNKYVEAIISLGHTLNIDVISEGVETDEQLEALKNIGCDFIQGFIWGRPMQPEDAAKLVKCR